jgi:AcrR family transcriptional regulator
MAIDEAYFARAEGEGTRRKPAASTRRRGSARRASQREPLTREDWIRTARAALIKGGIGAVRIVPLARALGVTRGGFYWHFNGRKDLLNALLADWEQTNTAPFERIVQPPSRDGMAEFQALVDLWISESEYSPAWDSAMRNWAALSRQAAAVVKRVDERRIGIIREIFIHLGYRDPEALVRARIAYFHQVGYYTLGLAEARERRLELLPVYTASLIGTPPR